MNNPPAFPRLGEGFGDDRYDTPGMSLRDWFAGQALAGLLVSTERELAAEEVSGDPNASLAAVAYEYADAMLAERDK